MGGYVYLVGAGPGDPNLITLRGAQCLNRADVVLYDGLVNPDLLQHAGNAEPICVGKHGQLPVWNQEQIVQKLIGLAREGKVVVRLKGGDPAVFARIAEEADALKKAAIGFEIVPGITVALAAASYAGIPITHRGHASAVAFVAGHQQEANGNELDWTALARFPGTLVIYMGVTTAEQWVRALIAGGKSASTPVAIIRRCTWFDQKVLRCELREVTKHLIPASKLRPPVIVVIGEVAELSNAISWFQQRPLFGKRVLVTRPADQATEMREAFQDLGADVLCQPAIEIRPPQDWSDVDHAINHLSDYDWLIFSSRNGVEAFMDRMLFLGRDMRSFASCRIAAVGSRTAERLRDYTLIADLVPPEFHANSLVASLLPAASGKRCLHIRADRGRDVLREGLVEQGVVFSQIIAYRNMDVEAVDQRIGEMMQAGQIDWVTVTSGAIARSLHRLFGEALRKACLASISPVTSAAIREFGLEPACEASIHTMAGLVAAIKAFESQSSTA